MIDSSIDLNDSRHVENPLLEATRAAGPKVGDLCWLIMEVRDLSCSSISLHSDLVRCGKTSAYETPGMCVLRRKGEPRCILLASYLRSRGTGKLLLLRRDSILASDSRKYRSCRRRTVLGEGPSLSTSREPLESRSLHMPCRWPRMSSILLTSRREHWRVS